jgi:ribosome biogenesis GTPase
MASVSETVTWWCEGVDSLLCTGTILERAARLTAVTLDDLGWTEARAEEFARATAGKADVFPGRIAVEYNQILRVYVEGGEWEAVVSGRLKHKAARRAELPAVGDWVVVRRRGDERRAAVVAVLPRSGYFSRKVAGAVTDEQVVAANIDVAFIVTSLDADFSPRRLERYLLVAREGGVDPVVLLSKPDVCDDVPARVAEAVIVAGDAPVLVVNPKSGEGMARVVARVTRGRTYVLLGSSGVGKSTIVNRLVGRDVRRTQEVRADDAKGRHTTTHRELVRVPTGGWLIDTPGMRELQLWEVHDGLRQSFDDVEAFAAGCHFSNCRHLDEPRCAVKEAVESGALAAERLTSYQALQQELRHLEAQQSERLRLEERRRGKIMSKALRAHLKQKGR